MRFMDQPERPQAARERSRAPEVWGGVECSVVRVGDHYRDQASETGHARRLEDMELIAALGVKAMRYPVLWEKVAPGTGPERHWDWTDERLDRLRRSGIAPIVGLVHHGSGPMHTDLLDPEFAEKLAAYAGEVAARYPWVKHWTPVNEPLTTARFSCLYGHWHPHKRDYSAFLQATVNQCRAVALAMQAIRAVIPDARLVQTEDMGRTFSTPELGIQAKYENHRRWLSLDLLMGHVRPGHPLWNELLWHDVPEAALRDLAEGWGAPDIMGINHYLTSDRYLDHRIERFPGVEPGGNGRQIYVDVEAVRVVAPGGETGPQARLREVWERYRRPMAVTEAHNGCTREEQLRWLMEVWQAVVALRAEGADIRAVTVWSLFGAVDWCSLLTRRQGIKEEGPLDMRGPEPRPTLLAAATRELAQSGAFEHPALDTPGWWRREGRFIEADIAPRTRPVAGLPGRPILVTGATGTLGRAFRRICEGRGLPYILTTRREMDIADEASVARALAEHRPWAVINTAGFVRVDEAELNPEQCFRENTLGPANLAKACAEQGMPLVTFSSDLVFDGQAGRSYVEGDRADPSCVYGASKLEAERLVLETAADHLVVRTSAFFGPWDEHNFISKTIEAAARGEEIWADDDRLVSPTYVPDLVHATLDLLLDGERGLWHVANPGEISWHDLAREAVTRVRGDVSRVRRPDRSRRRLSTALSSSRAVLLPSLEKALSSYFRDAPRQAA